MSQGSSMSASWFSLFDNGTNYCNLRNIMKGRWSSHTQTRAPADPQSLCCHFSSKQEVDSPRLPVLLNSLMSGCVWVTSSLPASSQLGGKIWVSFANTLPKKFQNVCKMLLKCFKMSTGLQALDAPLKYVL